MLCSWGSAVCGWWFVVQGTRLAVLCLRARVLGACGAWVWCGWASCPGPPFLLGGVGWGVCCRVLGRCALVWPVWCPAGGVLVGAAVGGLVVICIVDASIFVLCVARAAPLLLLPRFFLCCGWGCGGVVCGLLVLVGFVFCFFGRSVDALASGADEGRGGLRYSSGSRLAGCDPRVSEWGDPARVMSCHLHLNCIGCGG